jgi:S-adenosylmethionine-dependent methyltransferase
MLRGRRRRTLVLAGGAAAWLVAAIGAFVGNSIVLGLGLLVAGAVSVVALKLVMEVHSQRRPSPQAQVGREPQSSSAPSRSPAPPVEPDHGRLELDSERAIAEQADLVATIRSALIEHHFSKLTGWTDETGPERFRVDLDRHSYMRHDAAVTYIVPWVNQAIRLTDASIVEIGCGTGSSTAAFAASAGVVHGYDISPSSIAAATVRLDAQGLADRAELVVASPERLLATVEDRHAADPVDIVLLYALLEHQTVDERIETLRLAQRIVRPGGAIVITETPNRLTYFDRHTSWLPFFHMLPVDLQLHYADRSPRATFADNVAAHRQRQPGDAALRELMIRWGQSVSFHDFEVAIGDVNDRILASGLHPNLMKLRPERPEEQPLREFLRSTDLSIHPGFTRYYLDLIIAV